MEISTWYHFCGSLQTKFDLCWISLLYQHHSRSGYSCLVMIRGRLALEFYDDVTGNPLRILLTSLRTKLEDNNKTHDPPSQLRARPTKLKPITLFNHINLFGNTAWELTLLSLDKHPDLLIRFVWLVSSKLFSFLHCHQCKLYKKI